MQPAQLGTSIVSKLAERVQTQSKAANQHANTRLSMLQGPVMLHAIHTADAFLPSVNQKTTVSTVLRPDGMHTLIFVPSMRQLICQFNNSYASKQSHGGKMSAK